MSGAVPGVLITGGGGQLASDLEAQLAPAGNAVALSHRELDITDETAVERALQRIHPRIVINCAAFHNVDECERRPQPAWGVNVLAVQRLARRCAAAGTKLVHVSTNYVFDGERREPYAEDDLPSPRSIYALTKLAGEYAALGYTPDALVIRTGGLYGKYGSASKGGNFVQRMIARARNGDELTVVADQRLSPTYTADLAAGILEALDRGASGLLHMTNGDACSWYEFTAAIMELAGIDAVLNPGSTARDGGVFRPLNGVLASSRAQDLDVSPLRHWRDALAAYISEAVSAPVAEPAQG